MDDLNAKNENDIAIIGMAGRFPDAPNIDEFWENIKSGKESIHHFSDIEFKDCVKWKELVHLANFIAAKGDLNHADCFDAEFFKISPSKAKILDPQIRVLLELTWQAWENAGYNVKEYDGKVGVYASSSTLDNYWHENILKNQDYNAQDNTDDVYSSNTKDFLATRIAYHFDFKGPALNIQTACSSTLVAFDKACEDILNNKCDAALVAAACISFPLKSGYFYKEGMIYSKDGRCCAFGNDASGIVPGNGGGVVLLKRLSHAISDGDHIYANIKGSAVNNDGYNKLSFSAPSTQGQYDVLTAAARNANIDPSTIGYIEAHGSATVLGDQVEMRALKQYRKINDDYDCYFGSVKSNIGHLDVAAGMAGLIKATLALYHKKIPKTLHADITHPGLSLEQSGFKIANNTVQWCSPEALPRRSGVSSFGIGGTNAHVILEEHLPKECDIQCEKEDDMRWFILPLSAKTNDALLSLKDNLAIKIYNNSHYAISDISYTLQAGRCMFEHRLAVVCSTRQEAYNTLFLPETFNFLHYGQASKRNKNVYLFPNELADCKVLLRNLYESKAIINKHINNSLNVIHDILNIDIEQYFKKKDGLNNIRKDSLAESLLIFTINYAFANYWADLGVQADAVIGLGLGEIAAACFAGVFSQEDAVRLINAIACMEQHVPSNIYLSLLTSPQDISDILSDHVSFEIIAHNAPMNCDIKISYNNSDRVKNILDKNKIIYQEILSTLGEEPSAEKLDQLRLLVNTIKFNSPKIPFVSAKANNQLFNITEMAYWLNIYSATNYYQAICKLLEHDHGVFIEIGSGQQLIKWVQQSNNYELKKQIHVFESLPGESYVDYQKLAAINIAKLWVNGQNIHWNLSSGVANVTYKPARLPLSPYPFAKTRHCIEPNMLEHGTGDAIEIADDVSFDLMLPKWSELSHINRKAKSINAMIYASDQHSKISGLINRIRNKYSTITIKRIDSLYHDEIDSDKAIEKRQQKWLSNLGCISDATSIDIMLIQSDGYAVFYDLQALSKAIACMNKNLVIRLTVIVEGLVSILANDPINVLSSLVLGPIACLPLESSSIQAQCIDINYQHLEAQSDLILDVIECEQSTGIVAIRNGKYYSRHLAKQQYNKQYDHYKLSNIKLKKYGVYVITGGCGGIGLTIADYLARQYNANILLISRTQLPDKSQWVDIIANQGSALSLVRKLQYLLSIEKHANQLLMCNSDIANLKCVSTCIEQIKLRFGMINGVFHAASSVPKNILQNKSYDQVQEMFSTKIDGLSVLQQCFDQSQLDFMMLFSGLNVYVADQGMADYISANAYFHACAQSSSQLPYPVIATAWDTWSDVGMRRNYLERSIEQASTVYALGYGKWAPLVAEHLVNKKMLLVGAMYIEASIAKIGKGPKSFVTITLNKLSFLAPGIVTNFLHDQLVVNKINNHIIEIYLYSKGKKEKLFRSEYAVNNIDNRLDDFKADKIFNAFKHIPMLKNETLQKFNKRCESGEQPHWHCLEWVRQDGLNYLAKIEINAILKSEIEQFYLHPSVLDIAYSFNVQFLDGIYLPYFIDSCVVYQALQPSFYSLVEIKQQDGVVGICVSNVTLFTEDGQVLLIIKGLVLKRLTKQLNKSIETILGLQSEKGLATKDALSALEAIFAMSSPEVVIKKHEQAELGSEAPVISQQEIISKHADHKANDDNDIYENHTLSEGIAIIWRRLFGFDAVSMQDKFFDYGDSFMAIELCHKINTLYDINVSPYLLFQFPMLSDFVNACAKL